LRDTQQIVGYKVRSTQHVGYYPILFSLLKKGFPFIVSTVTVRSGFLCDKAALLRDTIKRTVYYIYIGYANPAA
jgi:hypothetical protein